MADVASDAASAIAEQELREKVTQWLSWDLSMKDKQEVEDLIKNGQQDELKKLFAGRIAFGTAGLRGRMGAGPMQMNDLVVQQTTQGLVKYLEKCRAEKESGVVIGYDARHRSLEFAQITAAVFLDAGFKVYLYREIVPTPFVPFGILHHKAAAGVMVTASHNPKADNGYKLYWNNGCQIVSPHESNITEHIMANLPPLDVRTSLLKVKEKSYDDNFVDTVDEVAEVYYAAIAQKPYCWFPRENSESQLKITFTPMHGVGQKWAEKAFQAFQLKPFVSVDEQKDPDPEFSTVTFPNPEEGKGVLKLAIAAADENNSPVILANDPDSDRCAVAEKNPKTGEWRTFTGDEVGIFFAAWVWARNRTTVDASKKEASNFFMCSTAVSSQMLRWIADAEGFSYFETLTGFKYLGNEAVKRISEGMTFLLGYEDAIGYMPGPLSFDKDGIRTAGMLAELASHLYAQGKTLRDYLEEQYAKYGYYMTANRYYFCYDPAKTAAIFDDFRKSGLGGGYPTHLGEYHISNIRDLTVGYDDSKAENKPILPVSASSQMITLFFDNIVRGNDTYRAVVTMRGSGTEPKVKYYIEAAGKEKDVALEIAKDLEKTVIRVVYRPEHNNLTAPPDM